MGYYKNIFPINHPSVLAIEIQENKEELVDAKNLGGIAIGSPPEIFNNSDYTKMRKTVYNKLLQAQNMLPENYSFCLHEAYRSLELQTKLFENRLNLIRLTYPSKSYVDQFYETIKLISPVINLDGSENVPPHATGGAFDVYLVDKDNQPLDMGLHPKDKIQDLEGIYAAIKSNKISDKAKANRTLMANILEKVGFVNYPGEYWHWSYGDKYWAYFKKQNYALYGSV